MRINKICRLLGLFALLGVHVSGAAVAGQFSYDPSKCSSDAQGMIYVALDREVFRFPHGDLTFIGTIKPDGALEPPHPTDPLGCPDNPLRANSFSFAISYPGMPSGANLNPMLEQFEILKVSPNYWGLQDSNISTANTWCNRPDVDRRKTNDDIEECRLPNAGDTAAQADRGGAFQAIPERYAAPFGRPYVVICPRAIVTTCEVNYKYLRTVNLQYKFFLSRLRPSDFIEFDKSLRARLDAARQLDYPWRN